MGNPGTPEPESSTIFAAAKIAATAIACEQATAVEILWDCQSLSVTALPGRGAHQGVVVQYGSPGKEGMAVQHC